MNAPKNLSYDALEEALNEMMGNVAASLTPTKLLVHPSLYRIALKVLRGAGWHHKHTARWRYLVRRGARK